MIGNLFTSLVVASALMSGVMLSANAQDSFGSGGNAFTMDFVEIGNPGNPDDSGTTGLYHSSYGNVANTFRMGTYEVSEDMINKANALGGLGITHNSRGADKPASSISWNEAARFVNWLNVSNGHSAAYKFADQPGDGGYSANTNIELWQSGDAGYDASNLYRNANAMYFLPSEDEWYKAAYYGGSGTTYSDYTTGGDSAPDGIDSSGDSDFDAVIDDGYNQGGPNDITNAGDAASFYGTFGQGGNIWEWHESAGNGYNGVFGPTSENRAYRGGNWLSSEFSLRSSTRYDYAPTSENSAIGFRVASIPEPSAVLMLILGALGLMYRRRFARCLLDR
ncbi:SUMF1/EgtB/PvdO family nonheme iron enzyme [Kiritimatiellota bacterium B12222]|nr:SUMF1/EgtB/PvdO family nonheme iron enzyme [Kiritimatiellota bacterium B12222]